MRSDWAMYCPECWQEFDFPGEYAKGSWLLTSGGRQRLNAVCHGKIRMKEANWKPKTKTPKPEAGRLNLDAGEPIKIR